jgi:hypothetical protein
MPNDSTATLELRTLHLLSDPLCGDFKRKVRAAVEDCRERPGTRLPRTITLTLSIKPHPDDADDVIVTPKISGNLPQRTVEPIRARTTRAGQLQFDFDPDIEHEAWTDK